MLSKNELKYIQSLSQKKKRDEEGVFIAEGPKIAEELLQSEWKLVKIYATAGWINAHHLPNHLITEVGESDLQRISQLQTPHQVLMIVQKPVLPAFVWKPGFYLVLDDIQDPGNFGTIIRIADWFGIETIIASEGCADLYNSKVIQASMGSFIRIKVFKMNLETFLQQYASYTSVYGALLQGENVYHIQKITEGILIIGNESKGIQASLLPYIQRAVTIPRKGTAESLNAAVATGILLSHLLY